MNLPQWFTDGLASVVLITIAVLLSRGRKWEVEGDIMVGALRAGAQLIAVGYALEFVFGENRLWLTLLILCVMVMVGARTAMPRRKGNKLTTFWLNAASIGIAAATTISILWLAGIVEGTPRYLIPLAGMAIGNTTTSITLTVDRFGAELWAKRGEVDARLSLGATSYQSSLGNAGAAARAGMTGTLNTMRIVGIVQLPGAMVGMILAGAPPLEAIRLQLIVVYMLACTNSLGTAIALRNALGRAFTRDHQLVLANLPRE